MLVSLRNIKNNKIGRLVSYFNFSDLIKFKIIEEGSEPKEISAKVGDNLLEVAKNNNINIIGACEGNCACATCHVIFDKSIFNKLPKATEQEEDMLETAPGLTSYSRLACQIKIEKYFNNSTIILPKIQRNISLDVLRLINSENKKI